MLVEALPNSTVTYLLHLVMGVMTTAAFFKLRRSYRDNGAETLHHFSRFFGMFSLFMYLQGLPFLVPQDLSSVQLGAFFIFGHIFLYASLAYLALVPLSIWRPEWKKFGFWGNVVAGAVVTFVNVLFWTKPTIEGGIVLFNVGAPVGPLIGIVDIVTMILLAGVFFAKMAYERSGTDRSKFLLLALGMLVITAGGPLHDNATNLMMYVVADILTISGFVFVMSGLYVDWIYEKLGIGE